MAQENGTTAVSPPGSVLLTGGGGYIGSLLAPELLSRGYRVTVFDCLLFGEGPLAACRENDGFNLVRGDIRDHAAVTELLDEGGFDAVIHLAAISNDPSSELDPELTRAVNFTAVEHLMRAAEGAGVRRFLYASSASVYGIKDTPDVTETLSLEPVTLYAELKARGEDVLNGLVGSHFCGVSVRAATVCGLSPRLRLDLTINILTEHAVRHGEIRVFGGSQMRPNIHIGDLVDFYADLLVADHAVVAGRAFNVSTENSSVMGLAERIRAQIDPGVEIRIVPTDDLRSYHLSADRARAELGFAPKRTLDNAIGELAAAFGDGRIPDPDDAIYRNVVLMKQHPEFWQREG